MSLSSAAYRESASARLIHALAPMPHHCRYLFRTGQAEAWALDFFSSFPDTYGERIARIDYRTSPATVERFDGTQ